MKFKMTDGRKIEFAGVSGYAVTSREVLPSGDVAVLDVNGRHGRTKTTLSDRFYYVSCGTGRFVVGDETFEVAKDDVIVVPKDTEYDFEGQMRVIIFCSPAFDPEYEILCEHVDSRSESI